MWESFPAELSILLGSKSVLSDLETVTAAGLRARQCQCRNGAPTLKRIASPEINPFGKLSLGVGHDFMLLMSRKSFGEALPKKQQPQNPQESYHLSSLKIAGT